jgi:hypothetical protein
VPGLLRGPPYQGGAAYTFHVPVEDLPMPDPLSRLQMARDEINKIFGPNVAEQHFELVVAVMNAASSDWAAITVARALQNIADALLIEEAETQRILPAHELLRARP